MFVRIEIPKGWELLAATGDEVEAGQVIAISWPRGEGPDVVAPFAGVLLRNDDGEFGVLDLASSWSLLS